MIQVLEPLARIPGVRVAALLTLDGVPVAVRRMDQRANSAGPAGEAPPGENMESLCGLAMGLFAELGRVGKPVSWDQPNRAILRATRGTVVLQAAPNGLLLAVLDRGASCEDLRLPMEGAVARVQRVLRNMGTNDSYQGGDTEFIQAPLPNRQITESGITERQETTTADNSQIGDC